VLVMADGVSVFGGFAGDETALEERVDPLLHQSVLDGDGTARHVVMGASSARLDGFVITGGAAFGSEPDDRGGGLYSQGTTDLVVAQVRFVSNQANQFGGGLYHSGDGLTIDGSEFEGNAALQGGALYSSGDSGLTVSRSAVRDNTASFNGGGLYLDGGTALVSGVWIEGNALTGAFVDGQTSGAGVFGGGVELDATNCVVRDNQIDNVFGASSQGAGLYFAGGSDVELTHLTVVDNHLVSTGAAGGVGFADGSGELLNSIVWGNTATASAQIWPGAADLSVRFSDVEGGWSGEGNLDPPEDPLFVSAYNDVTLQELSPFVDRGVATAVDTDIDGLERSSGAGPDMGAFELQMPDDRLALTEHSPTRRAGLLLD